MNADFFLTSITENFSWVCHSFGSRFLRPSAHFIFILVKSVAAKDMTLYKGCWGDLHQLYAIPEIIGVLRPPGCCEDIMDIVPTLDKGRYSSTEELD